MIKYDNKMNENARKEIEDRSDIRLLVETFYGRIKKHKNLGPVFNSIVDDWPAHIDKLVDFWTTNLFLVKAYDGNPMKVHLDIERETDHKMDQQLFGNWLELWFKTVDEYFIGANATRAKEHARNMAHILFMRIFDARKDHNQDMGIQIK